MRTTVRIAETDDLEVFLHCGSSPYLLITWNEMETKADGHRFWGDRLAQAAGINAIGIMAKRPNWFPQRAVEAVALHIRRYSDAFAHKVLYGHSMGGYAAVKFSRLFDAHCSIAFCPQYSIDPQDVGTFDRRYVAHFDPDRHCRMAITTDDVKGNTFLFYDPYFETDRANVDLVAEHVPASRRIPLPMTGHDTIWLFASSALGTKLIEACLRDDMAVLREIGGRQRRSFKLRGYYCAMALARKKPRWAKVVFDASRVAVPEPRKIAFYRALAEAAEPEIAEQALREALATEPQQGALMEQLARILLHQRRAAEAGGWAEKALALNPSNPYLLDLYGAVLMEQGRLDEARPVLLEAVRLAPRIASFMRRLSQLHRKLHDLDAALDWAE